MCGAPYETTRRSVKEGDQGKRSIPARQALLMVKRSDMKKLEEQEKEAKGSGHGRY